MPGLKINCIEQVKPNYSKLCFSHTSAMMEKTEWDAFCLHDLANKVVSFFKYSSFFFFIFSEVKVQ